MAVGISYSDFWKMTIGEIGDVLRAAADRKRAENKEKSKILNLFAKRDLENAALIAYYSGLYSRPGYPIPDCLRDAFPTIFSDGPKQQSWEQTYMILEKKRQQFIAKKERENANN